MTNDHSPVAGGKIVSKRGKMSIVPSLHHSWQQLKTKFPEHSSLDEESIYSLPHSLVDAVRRFAPGVLTSNDEAFERALADAAPCGFFRRERFHYPPLVTEPHPDDSCSDLDSKLRESNARLKQMLVDNMQSKNVPKMMIKNYFDVGNAQREAIEQRRWNYAGWVATSSEFRRHRDIARSSIPYESRNESLPAFRFSLTETSPGPGADNLTDESRLLLQLWGLEGFATWDLPLPMLAKGANPAFYELNDVTNAGITFFIPWYLLRDKSINFHELAEREMLLMLPTHMAEWINPKPRDLGPTRYGQLLRLYVYLELALKRRYAPTVKGQLAKLDRAFSAFFLSGTPHYSDESDESIRKIRLWLTKRLKAKASNNPAH